MEKANKQAHHSLEKPISWHMSNQRFVSRIYKLYLELNKRKRQPVFLRQPITLKECKK